MVVISYTLCQIKATNQKWTKTRWNVSQVGLHRVLAWALLSVERGLMVLNVPKL